MKQQQTTRCMVRPTNLLLSCFLGATLLLSCPATAQTFRLAPRLNGQRFVEASGGLVDRFALENSGWHGSLSTGRYNKNLNAWKCTINYVRKPLTALPTDSLPATVSQRGLVQQFTIGYGKEFTLYKSVFCTFLVRGQVVPFIGYESVRADQPPTVAESSDSPRSRLLAGADFGLEVEFQPVVMGIRQRWSPTSDVGWWGTLVFVGVRLGW